MTNLTINIYALAMLILCGLIINLYIKLKLKEKDMVQLTMKLKTTQSSYITKLTYLEFANTFEFILKQLLIQVLQEDVVHYSTTADSNKSKYVSIHANLLVRVTKYFEPHLEVIDAIYGPNFIEDNVRILMQAMIMDTSQHGLDAKLARFVEK